MDLGTRQQTTRHKGKKIQARTVVTVPRLVFYGFLCLTYMLFLFLSLAFLCSFLAQIRPGNWESVEKETIMQSGLFVGTCCYYA